MHETDFGVHARRRARYTADVEEMATLEYELAEAGAYIAPGRPLWRGLSGRDPYDEIPDEVRSQWAYEDWHDGMYDAADPERPERRRPSGREFDIRPPVVFDVTARVDPAIAERFAAAQAVAPAGGSWEASSGGTVTVLGAYKTWSGPCAECGTTFEQRRPVSQRRRWKTLCSPECAADWARVQARERKRRQRERDAA
ncbi:hypothetical protein [Streptomyces chartreusis]